MYSLSFINDFLLNPYLIYHADILFYLLILSLFL